MRLALFFTISILGLSTFQHGCGSTDNPNKPSANNQYSVIASASPTQPPSTATPPPNQDATDNGISAEEAKELSDLRDRCKHAPVNSAKVAPLTGTAPLKVTFDGGLAYDPDGTKIVKWEWHFGNGQSSEGRRVSYIYEKPGKYGVGLNVTDSQGQKASDCSTGATDIQVTVVEKVNSSENPIRKEN